MPHCGPKCSACMMVTGLWGMIFLAVLGLLFQLESVGLIEDLKPAPKGKEVIKNGTEPTKGPSTEKWPERKQDLKDDFHQNALNCWIACAAHAVTFVGAGIRLWMTKDRL